jgi:hypothetical protein
MLPSMRVNDDQPRGRWSLDDIKGGPLSPEKGETVKACVSYHGGRGPSCNVVGPLLLMPTYLRKDDRLFLLFIALMPSNKVHLGRGPASAPRTFVDRHVEFLLKEHRDYVPTSAPSKRPSECQRQSLRLGEGGPVNKSAWQQTGGDEVPR